MQPSFGEAYKQLNAAQREAVDTIDGPLLVLAGPGTGKTQLLSTRAANIVRTSSVDASNILCLTYTETGASEMRQRLVRTMGVAGGEVAVHTFHSFGSWLINQYPERFSSEKSLSPLDDLTRYTLIADILSKLPLRHQLAIRDEQNRFIRQHAVTEAIRAFKQAGLDPQSVRKQLKENEAEYSKLQPLLDEIFASNLHSKRLASIREQTAKLQSTVLSHSYSDILLHSLELAIVESEAAGKTAPLGKWRDKHTVIKDGKRILKSAAQSDLLHTVADIFASYQKELTQRGRFDYEDMILWAIQALERDTDMQLDIAERFQYIMVDEFQDTNGAQNRLLNTVLQAHPLDAPNVMVVGDDDQAIMRFQGAEASVMLQFIETYKPRVIALKDNYRSGQNILDASRQIMTQADDRLEVLLPELQLTKLLTAQSTRPKAAITYESFASPVSQYEAVAQQIITLLKKGTPPSEIGVIGRKHAELVAFVPHLTANGIAVNYDRHDNIIEHPAIAQLLALAEYISALAQQPAQANSLLPGVLAAPYWQLDALQIYALAAHAKANKQSWLDAMLGYNTRTAEIAEWLLAAAEATHTNNFTQMLDILLGRQALDKTKLKTSPYAHLYTDAQPDAYVTILSHLLRLREAVLENMPQASSLADMLAVVEQYQFSNLVLVDSNPILRGNVDSVHIMSAHGAKGREFEHVFILSTVDEVWGNRARSNNQRIFLPENMPLYPAGDIQSDKLRLLYVAMTRAKSQLHLASYSHTDQGKAVTPLGFFGLGDEGWWIPQPVELKVSTKTAALEHAWLPISTTTESLQTVLQPALNNFHLSATALRDFLDLRYAGPQQAIEKHVLKFPSAYNASSALGHAVHDSLQTAHAAWQKSGKLLTDQQLLRHFDEVLQASGLTSAELKTVRQHGHEFLPPFVRQFAQSDFEKIAVTEQFLTAVSPTRAVPLSGAVDALAQVDDFHVRVIDYKTGSAPLPEWNTKGLSDSQRTKLYFYKQQLLFYKLLVDHSSLYDGKQTVASAELVFAEKNQTSNEYVRLSLNDFTAAELEQTEKLMHAVYSRIMSVNVPDTSAYSRDLKGILAFEADLLAGTK